MRFLRDVNLLKAFSMFFRSAASESAGSYKCFVKQETQRAKGEERCEHISLKIEIPENKPINAFLRIASSGCQAQFFLNESGVKVPFLKISITSLIYTCEGEPDLAQNSSLKPVSIQKQSERGYFIGTWGERRDLREVMIIRRPMNAFIYPRKNDVGTLDCDIVSSMNNSYKNLFVLTTSLENLTCEDTSDALTLKQGFPVARSIQEIAQDTYILGPWLGN